MAYFKCIFGIKLLVLMMITLSCGIQHNLIAQTNKEGFKTQILKGDLLIYQTNNDDLIEEFYFIQGIGNVPNLSSLKSIEVIDGFDEIVLKDWGNNTYAFTVNANKLEDEKYSSVIGIGQYVFSEDEFLTLSALVSGYSNVDNGEDGPCPLTKCVHGGCGSIACSNGGANGCSVTCQSGYNACCRTGVFASCRCYSRQKCCASKE